MDNEKFKWDFTNSRLGLTLEKDERDRKYITHYGFSFGGQVFETREKAIAEVEPWAEKRIINLKRDIRAYEKLLKYIKKLKEKR